MLIESISHFSMSFWHPKKRLYIQFCRASEALSIGIWLYFLSLANQQW